MLFLNLLNLLCSFLLFNVNVINYIDWFLNHKPPCFSEIKPLGQANITYEFCSYVSAIFLLCNTFLRLWHQDYAGLINNREVCLILFSYPWKCLC